MKKLLILTLLSTSLVFGGCLSLEVGPHGEIQFHAKPKVAESK